jgi:hypothetical protein
MTVIATRHGWKTAYLTTDNLKKVRWNSSLFYGDVNGPREYCCKAAVLSGNSYVIGGKCSPAVEFRRNRR